jgi:hypothetical protein
MMDGASSKKRLRREILAEQNRLLPQSASFSDALIEETKEVWAPYYGKRLTDERYSII